MKTKTENPVHIQYVDIERIIPYEKNAKIHDQKQIDNVAESLRRFGWKQPLVIDGKDVLVIGHCRLLAAKKLGEKKVPVIIADELSEEDIKTLRYIDNKTNESAWDAGILETELPELDLSLFDFGFDLDDTAFQTEDIGEEYIDEFFDRGEEKKEKPEVYAARITFGTEEELQEGLKVLTEMGYQAARL